MICPLRLGDGKMKREWGRDVDRWEVDASVCHANGVGCDGLSALMDPRNSRSAVKPRDGRSQKP